MKKIILFSIMLLVASCVKQMQELESEKIAGMWAVVDDSDYTSKYFSFAHGSIMTYESGSKKFYVGEKSVWATSKDAFKVTDNVNYTLMDGVLYYRKTHLKVHVDGESMTLGSMKCRRVENFKSERYSTIKVSDPNILFSYKGGDQVWSYSVTRRVDGFALKVAAPSWINNIRVTADKISFTVSQTTADRSGVITLSYPNADDLKITVSQKVGGINLNKTSVTLGYVASSSSFTYSISDPQSGYTLKAKANSDWITDVKDNGRSISFSVKENNTGSSRTGKITLTYGGATKEFTVTQTYSASSITLTPASGSHDYISGTYTFKYTVSNPREGQKAVFTASAQWITGITDSNGTVSYKVSENNSGSSRTGKITVTYAGVRKEFTVSQDLGPKNLSEGGTANCYVISTKGYYSFKSVKGNSSTSVGTVSSVQVLWETFGTSTTPSVGDMIKSVSYKYGNIHFETASTFKEGNAVIAAKDASGTILWSWHIWFTDQPQTQVYNNNAGTMMDRNLGATSATPGDVGALGLLYQWGRKDPFLGSSDISSSVEAKSTITWPSPVSTSSSTGTVSYVLAHPTVYVTSSYSTEYDWHYASRDNTLWSASYMMKSIYDPCPVGWRVPDYDVWSKAGFGGATYDSTNEGVSFSISSPSKTWYPASGYRDSVNGSLRNVGNYGYYRSASPSNYSNLFFKYNGSVSCTESMSRAYGLSVRCVKE